MNESDGAPAGVKVAADDGGGPAGVVEGYSPMKEKPLSDLLSGVDGAGLESGTMKRCAMVKVLICSPLRCVQGCLYIGSDAG